MTAEAEKSPAETDTVAAPEAASPDIDLGLDIPEPGANAPLYIPMTDPGRVVDDEPLEAVYDSTPQAGESQVHIRRSERDVSELWRWGEMAGRKCFWCSTKKVAYRFLVFMPALDFVRRAPVQAQLLASQNGGKLPCAKMKTGPFVCVTDKCACEKCAKYAEQILAKKTPSWCIFEKRQAPKHAAVVPVNGRRVRA